MPHKINLVRVLTSATGNSTPITLGAKYSQLFLLPSEAGAMDGRTYSYLIVDGNNWERGRGVYTASGTTLARNVTQSWNGSVLGTSRISLSGTAQVRFAEPAEDMDGVRGTRAVTGTSDTLNDSDLGYVVTYSNASAVAVSLAQASVSNLFMDGWAVWVKNKGAGAVTITPATSTIDGAATLVLAQNQGALIWSDGTNYQSFKLRGDLGTAAVRADTDFVRTDTAQSLSTSQQSQARSNAGIDVTTLSKTAGYTVVAADYGALIKCSGTFTLALTAAATLGDKFKVFVRNTGTGLVTLDPNASELVDGVATVGLLPGTGCWVICDGTGFVTIGRAVEAQNLSTTGYLKLAGGLIMQWGTTGVGAQTVTFPVAFPNACLRILAMVDIGTTTAFVVSPNISTPSTTSFTTSPTYSTGGSPTAAGNSVSWIALGN
jgi:hypothetical protein